MLLSVRLFCSSETLIICVATTGYKLMAAEKRKNTVVVVRAISEADSSLLHQRNKHEEPRIDLQLHHCVCVIKDSSTSMT